MQPVLFFEPGPFPGLPGPAVGPKGPKFGQKPGAGFIILSSLRSAQPSPSRLGGAAAPQQRPAEPSLGDWCAREQHAMAMGAAAVAKATAASQASAAPAASELNQVRAKWSEVESTIAKLEGCSDETVRQLKASEGGGV